MAYAKNPTPKFTAPAHNQRVPRCVQTWQKFAAQKELHLWTGWQTLRQYDDKNDLFKRGLYKQQHALLAEAVQCMLHHINVTTHHIHASYEQIADEIGASTTSAAKNKSISRISRLFNRCLIRAGLVECTQVWDKQLHCYVATHIQATPLFFEMLGLDYGLVMQAAEYYKAKNVERLLPGAEVDSISISKLQQLSKDRHFKKNFEKRRDKLAKAKLKSRAHRLHDEQHQHGFSKTINDIAVDIWDRLTPSERQTMSATELKHLTHKEAAKLRAIHPPPQ